jgi:outer membrane immunogenic protein
MSLINRRLTTRGKIMKKSILTLTAATLATIAAPAIAGDFAGPRVEVTAGADDVKAGVDPTKVTYGAGVGYDLQLGKIVAGVEANVDNVFDRRDIGVGARLGYVLNDNVLVYGKAGYSSWRQVAGADVEGLRLGGGLEVNLAGPVYGKVEYRYSDLEAGQKKHGGLVGLGLRF